MNSFFDFEEVVKYIKRIGLSADFAKEKPTYNLLEQLQLAHIYSVPYENVDIVHNTPISLDWRALYNKIVERRRGGYCFELNSLFEKLLKALGFSTVCYFARFWRGESGIPMRRHRVICVSIGEEKYIADVGIGAPAPRIPLALREGVIQEYFGESYRFEKSDDYGWILYELHHGEWQRYFSFTEEAQIENDFEAIHYYCEKHPDSVFNKSYIIAIKTPDGRKSIDGKDFKLFVGDKLQKIEENMTDMRLAEVLSHEFGITL